MIKISHVNNTRNMYFKINRIIIHINGSVKHCFILYLKDQDMYQYKLIFGA